MKKLALLFVLFSSLAAFANTPGKHSVTLTWTASTSKENSEMMEVNVSELLPVEISVSDALIEAHNRMWAIGPKRRKNIYHRWEMLRLFTPEMSRLFEQNLRRINNRGGE